MAGAATVQDWIERCDAERVPLVTRLRALALAAAPDVTEQIKWDAPSFCVDGDDRITLGLERKGGVRAVLHRGAKVRDANGFAFDDPEKLAKWPAADRGVMQFADEAALDGKETAVGAMFTRWLAATR
jgi:hypothetical protein